MLKKRLCAIVAAACLLLSLSGCGVDLYHNWRPDSNPNERWISGDPEMYFTWEDGLGHYGELTRDGQTTEVKVLFNYGTGMGVFPLDPDAESLRSSDQLFRCDCAFGKNTLVATVTRDDQNVFGGELPTFIFQRCGLQEDGTFQPLGQDQSRVLFLWRKLFNSSNLIHAWSFFMKLIFTPSL